jgi:hypothetical protein
MKKPPNCEDRIISRATGRYRKCPHPAKYLIAPMYLQTNRIVCGYHAKPWTKESRVPLGSIQ